MRIAQYFDDIYLGLNIAMLVGLALAVVFGLIGGRTADPSRRLWPAVALIAIGTAFALAGGLIADAALKSSPWFQQVRFGAYYLGFAAIVIGTIVVIGAVGDSLRGRRLSRALAVVFVTTVIIGGVFVTVPATFVLNQYREQIQLAVYWLPMLVAGAGGAVALIAVAPVVSARTRFRVILVAAFEALLFLGLLREAEIVPDLGDPLTNLLVAFVPFVVGAVCLAIAAAPQRQRTSRIPSSSTAGCPSGPVASR